MCDPGEILVGTGYKDVPARCDDLAARFEELGEMGRCSTTKVLMSPCACPGIGGPPPAFFFSGLYTLKKRLFGRELAGNPAEASLHRRSATSSIVRVASRPKISEPGGIAISLSVLRPVPQSKSATLRGVVDELWLCASRDTNFGRIVSSSLSTKPCGLLTWPWS